MPLVGIGRADQAVELALIGLPASDRRLAAFAGLEQRFIVVQPIAALRFGRAVTADAVFQQDRSDLSLLKLTRLCAERRIGSAYWHGAAGRRRSDNVRTARTS